MPHIEEHDLVALHSQIEKKDQDLEKAFADLQEVDKRNEKVENQRNIFIGVSAVLFLFLAGCIGTYLAKPNAFIKDDMLAENGLEIVNVDDLNEWRDKAEAYDAAGMSGVSGDTMDDSEAGETGDDQKDGVNGDNALLASNDVSNTKETTSKKASLSGKKFYAVQVGAFDKKMVSMYSDSFKNYKEYYEDEFYKYSFGSFETLAEARKFRRELVGIGFKDAFIASYQNGKRLKIEEAW
ncbi:SPOR domain-containing protein [Sungkyunkwania multivorans]|uniref:SPOR domain-containing protein n=1 Tax=Sungkyunkwania multivorans TaxID=1173618 RepID=A0ABW3CXK6_9FLAO